MTKELRMEKPKFRVPMYIEKKSGRITIFLASVAAVSYLIMRFSQDYCQLYENLEVEVPPVTQVVLAAGSFIQEFWWVVALAAIMLTLLFIAVTKTGTIFTVLSILVWLAGLAAYFALWYPTRAIQAAMNGG
jgi:type II secretory pathway component PulF